MGRAVRRFGVVMLLFDIMFSMSPVTELNLGELEGNAEVMET